MDRKFMILTSAPALGLYMTIVVKQVYWYISQISGERLKDHIGSLVKIML